MGLTDIAAAVILGLTLTGAAHGSESESPFDQNPARFVQLAHHDGFIVGICNRDRATLLDQLRHWRARLEMRREQLHAVAGDGQLSARDVLITLLMPGGLLYAAQRHDNIRRAESLRQQVDIRLEEMAAELRAFQGGPALNAGL